MEKPKKDYDPFSFDAPLELGQSQMTTMQIETGPTAAAVGSGLGPGGQGKHTDLMQARPSKI